MFFRPNLQIFSIFLMRSLPLRKKRRFGAFLRPKKTHFSYRWGVAVLTPTQPTPKTADFPTPFPPEKSTPPPPRPEGVFANPIPPTIKPVGWTFAYGKVRRDFATKSQNSHDSVLDRPYIFTGRCGHRPLQSRLHLGKPPLPKGGWYGVSRAGGIRKSAQTSREVRRPSPTNSI